MKSFISKPYKRDSCNASAVSLSLQSQSSKSSKSSVASSLVQAKQATAAAWTSLKTTCKKTCAIKTPLSSPHARSSVDNPFNDYTYRTDEPTRVGRLVHRLSGSKQPRYSAIDDSAHAHVLESARSDSDDDCARMTVVVTMEARAEARSEARYGTRYATAPPYPETDDEWYL